jgi:hypothetical protein
MKVFIKDEASYILFGSDVRYDGKSCPSALTEHHAMKAYCGVEV